MSLVITYLDIVFTPCATWCSCLKLFQMVSKFAMTLDVIIQNFSLWPFPERGHLVWKSVPVQYFGCDGKIDGRFFIKIHC